MAAERSGPLAALRILALDASTSDVGAALLAGGEVVAERTATSSGAAEALLPGVDALLREVGWDLGAIEAIAVSIGPGSFTGLRIAIATAKGLAFGTDRPLAAVPTLAALARAAGPGAGPVVAALDARRGEVYASGWVRGGEAPDPRVPESVYTPAALAARLERLDRAVLVGEGAGLCAEVVRARVGGAIRLLPELRVSAGRVGELGARLLARGRGIAPEELVPRYVRRAEAEVRRTGQRFEGPVG